ncbi:MAG: TetR/AcrR family transcriptional regulator, partial [Cytophagia bacterium]|nr:TetR/AcrR family transcriptional regulator [Cytophagia bacterium]
MVSNRQLEERNARRDRIIDGALRVFKRLGIDGVTMNEIAKESDFGKASLYYYFPSKEDVFQAIMENGWQNLWESIEDIVVNEQKPKKKFLTLLMTIAEIVKSNQTLYEFLFAAPKAIPMNSENFDSWKS